MNKRYLVLLLSLVGSLLLGLGLYGCQQHNSDQSLKVGVVSGPETSLMQMAKQVAKKQYGLRIEIIEFSDYTLPNLALADNSLDANMFQHLPYLTEEIKKKHYAFTVIGKVFNYPNGIYSNKIKTLSALPHNAQVAIPNDPTNEGRALLLLEKAGLIKLNPQAGFLATPKMILENPKQLRFRELDAAQLSRALPDVEIAVINTNYAVLANLYPTRDALFVEDKQSPYANVVVARESDKENPKLKQLMNALHSPEVLQTAEQLFKGQAIPAW